MLSTERKGPGQTALHLGCRPGMLEIAERKGENRSDQVVLERLSCHTC